MITRRDVCVALIAAAATAGGFALSNQNAAMGSAAIDWNSIPAKATESGSVRTFFRSPTATLKELEVHVTTLNPGQAPHAPHRHPNEELLIVKQGTIEALIDGDWKSVGAGSVVFFASNQLHGVRNAGSEQAVYHVVGFKTVIEVTHAGRIVFQQGMINVGGNGFNQLNGPYDAKEIGDFTGLTPPF